MQQSRDVLLVVVHTEVLLDPVLHHGPVPHACGEAGSLGTGPDDLLEPRQLFVGQTVRGARRTASPEPLNAVDVIPTDPLLDGGQGHVQLLGQLRRRLAMDVAEHRPTAPPCCQVGLRDGLVEKLFQLHELLLSPLGFTYRLAILGARHGCLRSFPSALSRHSRHGYRPDCTRSNARAPRSRPERALTQQRRRRTVPTDSIDTPCAPAFPQHPALAGRACTSQSAGHLAPPLAPRR